MGRWLTGSWWLLVLEEVALCRREHRRVGREERATRWDRGHLSAQAPFNRTLHPASLTGERLRKLQRRCLRVARRPQRRGRGSPGTQSVGSPGARSSPQPSALPSPPLPAPSPSSLRAPGSPGVASRAQPADPVTGRKAPSPSFWESGWCRKRLYGVVTTTPTSGSVLLHSKLCCSDIYNRY